LQQDTLLQLFFARLLRRSKVITEIEFVVKRYDASAQTSFLRCNS
jgi:hypothetical protein